MSQEQIDLLEIIASKQNSSPEVNTLIKGLYFGYTNADGNSYFLKKIKELVVNFDKPMFGFSLENKVWLKN